MAIYKFYNVQLLPLDTEKTDFAGVEGYCKLFEKLNEQLLIVKEEKLGLASIAVKMAGEMKFAPFSIDVRSTGDSKIVYGRFLKFDQVDEVVETESGDLLFKSKGNSSSKRFSLEFVFEPKSHILAIQDTKGLPARNPLIEALYTLLEPYVIRHFKDYTLTIDELTNAQSIIEFFEAPKKGYKRYSGHVTFSNSDAFDHISEQQLKPVENELKDKNVGFWEAKYRSFKGSLMNDLPIQAKIQMLLATKYGNAEAAYQDENSEKQVYRMQDFPVRLSLNEKTQGVFDKALAVRNLIATAKQKSRASEDVVESLKQTLPEEDKE